MNEFDKNFHLNFSPLYAAFVFMLFMLWASEVEGDDHNITFHGHTVDEQLLEVDPRPLFVGDITDTWHKDDDKLIIKTRFNEMYVLVIEACWNLNLAQSYLYGGLGWNQLHVIEPGLKVWPVVDGVLYRTHPCFVKKVLPLEVIG